jgi:threonine dehydrogenase-like Zn-dependent dehydrogenase
MLWLRHPHHLRTHGEPTIGPIITGREIVGKVVATSAAPDHKVGDFVGLGGLTNACGDCVECNGNQEQLCSKTAFVFNDKFTDDRDSSACPLYRADITEIHPKNKNLEPKLVALSANFEFFFHPSHTLSADRAKHKKDRVDFECNLAQPKTILVNCCIGHT